MRALLLLVLGAGLVWFVWRGLGPGRPAEDEAQAASPGAMIALEAPSSASDAARAPELDVAAEAKMVTDTPPAKSTPPAAPAPDSTRADVVSPVAADERPAVPGSPSSSPAEIAAAEELLRDPAALGAWLASRGVELPPRRRELAASLVHAFAAREADALAALDRSGSTGEVQSTERELVRRIAAGEAGAAPIGGESPLARAASMKDQERDGLEHLAAGRAREAAEIYSRLLIAEIESPWRAHADRLATWSEKLREAQRGHRWNRRGNWPSTEVIVQPGDSLISIRKRAVASDPNLVFCTGQIASANHL